MSDTIVSDIEHWNQELNYFTREKDFSLSALNIARL